GRDDPARARELLQHHPINHQRRGKPKRNNIRKRIELASKWTLVPTETCNASVQKIKNERAQNKPDCFVKAISCKIGISALQKSAFQDFERGGKSAKQISRRHQIRQQINLRRLFVHGFIELLELCIQVAFSVASPFSRERVG